MCILTYIGAQDSWNVPRFHWFAPLGSPVWSLLDLCDLALTFQVQIGIVTFLTWHWPFVEIFSDWDVTSIKRQLGLSSNLADLAQNPDEMQRLTLMTVLTFVTFHWPWWPPAGQCWRCWRRSSCSYQPSIHGTPQCCCQAPSPWQPTWQPETKWALKRWMWDLGPQGQGCLCRVLKGAR